MNDFLIENTPIIKYGWLRAIVYLLIWALLTLLITAPFYDFLAKNTGVVGTIYQEILLLIGTTLAIYICRVYIDRQSFISLGFAFAWRDLLWGCGLGFLLISLCCLVVWATGWVHISFRGLNAAELVNYFTLFILVAIFEEFMCRTYLLYSLMASVHKYWALLITASVFAIFHLLNPNFTWLSLANLVVAGVLLGLWYIYRLNIWFSVGLHLMWNYFQGSIYGFEVSGMDIKGQLFRAKPMANANLTGGSFGLEGSVITLVVLLLSCYVLNNYLQKTTLQPKPNE